jgi:hypothetical protein
MRNRDKAASRRRGESHLEPQFGDSHRVYALAVSRPFNIEEGAGAVKILADALTTEPEFVEVQ